MYTQRPKASFGTLHSLLVFTLTCCRQNYIYDKASKMSGQYMNSPLCVSSMYDLYLVQTLQKGTQRAVCVLCAYHKDCYSYQLWNFHELHDKQIGCTRNNGNDRVISNTAVPLLFTSPSFHT